MASVDLGIRQTGSRVKAVGRFAILDARAELGLAGILALVIALYLPTLNDPFHGDDFVAFKDFGTRPGLQYISDVFLFRDSNFYWRPLGCAFHFLLYELGGLNPMLFRAAGLGVFLLTLVALYCFCLGEKLGRPVALLSVAIFGLLPNHVVSVAWVTNTSRLQAVFFVLLALIVLQRLRGRSALAAEALAFVCFIAAVLSDETALALAPVVVLYATVIGGRMRWRSALLRASLFAITVAVLLPLQFQETLNDEPRLTTYEVGPHMVTQSWALVSQLVLPITATSPVDVMLYKIAPLQWAAGMVGIVAGVVLFAVGSMRLRFLLVWIVLALSPFTLWGVNYTSPRYVYMAALPYSIVLAWALVTAAGYAWRSKLRLRLDSSALVWSARAAVTAVVVVAAYVSSFTLVERNQAWSVQAERYGELVTALRSSLTDVPPHSRLVIYYSPWPDFWATSVVQSLYEDSTIRVINVRRGHVESGLPTRWPNDVVLFYTGEKFITMSPIAQTPIRTIAAQ